MSKLPFGKRIFWLLLVTGLLALTISCGAETGESEQVGVAVTILPQAEFVKNIGGDKVNITVMVPPGASPHTYEPTPSHMAALSKAKLYAKVGSGIEFELAWMDKLIKINQDMLIVDCSQGIKLQERAGIPEHEQDNNHNLSPLDPHIWMSPRNAQIMVRNISDGLIQVDPKNIGYYQQNRDAYLQKLARLDRDIRTALSGTTTREFMVYHPSLGYFARDYNLTMLPIEEAGKEPTPASLARLIEQAKQQNIKVIFASPQFNPQSARVIAEAIDGRLVFIDPLARDYIMNLRALLEELVTAME